MNKKDILKKSRKEFKNQDLPEIEEIRKMSVFSLVAVVIFACVIVLAEKHVYGEYNIGLMTVVFSATVIMGLYRCFTSKKKHKLPIIAATVWFALWFGFLAFCEITSLMDYKR